MGGLIEMHRLGGMGERSGRGLYESAVYLSISIYISIGCLTNCDWLVDAAFYCHFILACRNKH